MSKRTTLLITCVLYWFSLYLYIPYLTPALIALGLSSAAAGFIFSLHAVAQTVFRFPVGLASAKKGLHKGMVIQGCVFASLSGALMYLRPGIAMIAAGNALSGYASAMYVGYTVLYGSYYPPGQSNRAMGVIGALADVGILGAFLLGGLLHKAGGTRMIFAAAAIAGAAGLVFSFFVTEQKIQPSKGGKKDLRALLRNKRLIVSSLLGLIAKAIVFGTAWAFTTKLAEDIGAEGTDLSLINGLFIGASILGSFFVASDYAKRIGEARISAIGFCLLAFYAALIPLLKSVPLFWAVSFVGGLGYSSITSVFMANAVKTLQPSDKSAGMGVYQSLYSVGSALGPIMVGALADAADYRFAYMIVAVMGVLGAAFSVAAGKKGGFSDA